MHRRNPILAKNLSRNLVLRNTTTLFTPEKIAKEDWFVKATT